MEDKIEIDSTIIFHGNRMGFHYGLQRKYFFWKSNS